MAEITPFIPTFKKNSNKYHNFTHTLTHTEKDLRKIPDSSINMRTFSLDKSRPLIIIALDLNIDSAEEFL